MMGIKQKIVSGLNRERPIAPLVILRIAFGAILLISTIRFLAKGWVQEFYIAPKFHFTFYGFGWVRVLSPAGMYILFGVMLVSSLCITIGLFYRWAVAAFWLTFTYVELIDKSYYLNHYYFVSLFTFLLLLVPAHRDLSIDVLRKPSLKAARVPAWTILLFQVQLCLVYFLAGLSKLTPDWLLEAQPLRIWLPANADMPLIGPLLVQTWVAYAFSWFGAIFDLSIGFLLWNGRTRKFAYLFVIVFHVLTAALFKIGMFPWIMIAATLVFFPAPKWWGGARMGGWGSSRMGGLTCVTGEPSGSVVMIAGWRRQAVFMILGIYFLLQLLIPFRYLLYPGHLFWTEQGYRFSWRVMLMEKSGTAFFYVGDPATGRKGEVRNSRYLTALQERMMSTQPDMILQYAHYLHDIYQEKGIRDPVVTVESYVTLNGSGSRLYIDSSVNLARQPEDLSTKTWILPFYSVKP